MIVVDHWATQYQQWLEKVNATLVRSGRPAIMGWDEFTAYEELPADAVEEVADILELDDPWLNPR